MVTLAFAQMAYYVFHDTPLGGGTDGIYLNVKPVAEIAGRTLLDLDKPVPFYYFTLAALVLVVRLPRRAAALALRPRAGRHQGVNEQRMRATGFSTYALQARGLHAVRARSPGSPASCSR